MALYFAYGSNMLSKQMEQRCPGAKPVSTALLHGWRFLINSRGVATIIADEAGSVRGVVWELTEEHLRALDGYEGVPDWYQRRMVGVELPERGETECVTYIDESEGGDKPGPPRAGYLEKIVEGATNFGLPPAYIAFLRSFAAAPSDES
jgi:gamma-glutamylcyclotransferase (GGCT)/AIG2-like uncharacterized protein YtfP